MPANAKLQSAMEYLMTYGWAILIIAVVLGALFQLGIFNASTFTPKAPPGACHVFRPNGPMTTSFINTQGICNGELPQYVAKFNGLSSYINTGTTGLPLGSNPSSFSTWVYPTSFSTNPVLFIYGRQSGTNMALLFFDGSVNHLCFEGISEGCISTPVSLNAWHFVGWSYGGGTTVTVYLDGSSQSFTIIQQNVILNAQNPSVIGAYGGAASFNYEFFKGTVSNAQIYNASLSANEMNALYNEGIGGAPIQLKNLVGWWPLNGDTKDYSGNNNNGVPSGITFTSSWESGYSAP